MNTPPSVTLADFQQALEGDYVRVLQLISAAIAFGVFLFAFVVAVLILTENDGAAADPGQVDLIEWLSLVHLALAAAVYSYAGRVYDGFFSPERLQKALNAPPKPGEGAAKATGAARFLGVIRTAEIVRLAMLESVALFGLIVLLVGGLQGVVQAAPVYLLNFASTLFLLAFVVLNFPSAARLERLFREKIQR